MLKRYETQESQQINLSSVKNQSIYAEPFLLQIHNKYGIPLVQLQSIYVSSQSNRKKMDDESTELDYGQKLILNHNILKEMVYMIDNKSINNYNFKSKSHLNKSRVDQQKLDDKLRQVKKRLSDLINFIGEPIINENVSKTNGRQSDMNPLSYFQSSLQYSRDIIDEPKGKEQSRGKATNKQSNIYIRMQQGESSNEQTDEQQINLHRLQSAKEVTSQLISDNQGEYSKISNNGKILKKSLERISEVQSGQTISKQSQHKQKSRFVSNYNSDQSINFHNSKVNETQELDQTGQIILSTINKKITKVSVLSDKQRQSKQSISQISDQSINTKNGHKKSHFWKDKDKKLSNLFLKPAVSHQSIQQHKSFTRPRLKFDDFGRGFTFKSLQSSKNELSVNSGKQDYKNESHQISNTSKPQFIRYIAVNNSISNNSLLNSDHSLRAKNSLIKQSKIIQSFPSKIYDQTQIRVPSNQSIDLKPRGMGYLSRQVSNEQLKQTAHFQRTIFSPLKQSSNKASQLSQSNPFPRNKSMPNNFIIQQSAPTSSVKSLRKFVNAQYRPINQVYANPLPKTMNYNAPTNLITANISQFKRPYLQANQASQLSQSFSPIDRQIIYQKVVRKPKAFNPQQMVHVAQHSNRSSAMVGRLKKKGIQLTNINNKPLF